MYHPRHMYSASLLAKFYCWQENEVASDTKGKVIDLRFQRISEHKGRRKFEKRVRTRLKCPLHSLYEGFGKA